MKRVWCKFIFEAPPDTVLDCMFMVWVIVLFPTSYTVISSSARQVSYEEETNKKVGFSTAATKSEKDAFPALDFGQV